MAKRIFASARQAFYARDLLGRCGYPTDRLSPAHAGLPGTGHLDLQPGGVDCWDSVLEWLTGLSAATCSRLITKLERTEQ